MEIRKAQSKDIKRITELLKQVLSVHAKLRPDVFIDGTTKYTCDELKSIINCDNTPAFVAVDDTDFVVGYAFCIFKDQPFSTNMFQYKTLYIDDLCVDERFRGRKIGETIFKYVIDFARKSGCRNLTLNVWEGNDSARKFYKKMGMFVRETQMEFSL